MLKNIVTCLVTLTALFTNTSFVIICWGMSAKQIAQESFPSVVVLVMQGKGDQYSMGSGFLIQKDTIVTNFHVIKGANKGYAKVIGKLEQHVIIGTTGIDEKNDLALLSINEVDAPSLQLGDSGQVQVGDEIYAIGNPMGLEGTISNGIISGIRILEEGETRFQISAPISQGNSGGPLLNNEGKVIGISYAGLIKGQNLNFAIPV